jgi:hypothetical protein
MTAVQAIVAVLAAIGGVGGVVQLVNAFRAWRDGVKQREEEAEERLVKRLEARIDRLELERAQDNEYIRRLVMALGTAGIPIPSRAE